MKKLFLFLLLFIQILQSMSNAISLIPLAVGEIVRDFYANRSEGFHFIFHCHGKDGKFEKLVNEVVKVINRYCPLYNVIDIVDSDKDIEFTQSAVLMFDTVKAFDKLFSGRASLRRLIYHKTLHFLVYIQDLTAAQLNSLKPGLATSHNENFLIVKNDTIQLNTFITFQQPICRAWHIANFNEFSTLTKKWKNRELFLDKFNNFNGCELKVRLDYPSEPILNVKYDNYSVTKYTLNGYGITMIKEIAKNLNYSLYFNPYDRITKVTHNKSVNIDYFIHLIPIRLVYLNWAVHIVPFTTTDVIILISRSEPYSPFEKLFLPFEVEVWTWMIITLTTAVTTIIVVSFFPKQIRNFVFGNRVTTPLMNFV